VKDARTHSLEVEGERHARALADLKAKYPRLANDDLPEDDREAMADTLDGMTSLGEAVDAVVARIDDDERWALNAIPDQIRKLQARRARLKARADANREKLTHVLASCGVVTDRDRSYRRPGYTLAVPRPRRLVKVADPDLLPPSLMVPGPATVNLATVLDDLEAGTLPERYVTAPPVADVAAIEALVDRGDAVPGVEVVHVQHSVQVR
jgi:hypothetical protein